jgi:hypothetical protein
MFAKLTVQVRLILVMIIPVMVVLAGCTVKTGVMGDPATGINLTYRMAENQVLQYRLLFEITQEAELMGKQIEVNIKNSGKFSARSKGFKENNFLLGITLDTMDMQVKSTRGNITPDVSALTGKTFDIVLSPLGKELEYIGTESLQYELKPVGKRNLISIFKFLFPDLAEKKVKIGDSWTSKDETINSDGEVDMHITLDSVDTLRGVETVNGMECIKVTAKYTGTVDGKGNQGGAQVTIKGKSTGTGTWYFAYKKGIFVKGTAEMDIKSTTVISGRNLTIPSTMKIKTETNLI